MHCCMMLPAVSRFALSMWHAKNSSCGNIGRLLCHPPSLHRMNRRDGSYYITRTMQKDHRILTQSNMLSTTSLLEQMQSATVPQVRSRPNQFVAPMYFVYPQRCTCLNHTLRVCMYSRRQWWCPNGKAQ